MGECAVTVFPSCYILIGSRQLVDAGGQKMNRGEPLRLPAAMKSMSSAEEW